MDRKRRIAWRPIRVCIRIASLVLPSLKVHCLAWTDTEEDSQNFWVGYSLSKLRVEAGATLLNKAKVEARREGERLDPVSVVRLSSRSGSGRDMPTVQTRDSFTHRRCTPLR